MHPAVCSEISLSKLASTPIQMQSSVIGFIFTEIHLLGHNNLVCIHKIHAKNTTYFKMRSTRTGKKNMLYNDNIALFCMYVHINDMQVKITNRVVIPVDVNCVI